MKNVSKDRQMVLYEIISKEIANLNKDYQKQIYADLFKNFKNCPNSSCYDNKCILSENNISVMSCDHEDCSEVIYFSSTKDIDSENYDNCFNCKSFYCEEHVWEELMELEPLTIGAQSYLDYPFSCCCECYENFGDEKKSNYRIKRYVVLYDSE